MATCQSNFQPEPLHPEITLRKFQLEVSLKNQSCIPYTTDRHALPCPAFLPGAAPLHKAADLWLLQYPGCCVIVSMLCPRNKEVLTWLNINTLTLNSALR